MTKFTAAADLKRRLTIVMPSAEPTGGAEEAFLQFIRSSKVESLSLQVCFLERGSLERETERLGILTCFVEIGRTREIGKWWRAAGKIANFACSFNADCILGWMTKGHVYGGLAAWRAGIPAAWFQMGLPESGLLDRVARRLPAKTVLACSEYVAKLQRLAQPRVPVIAVPLGVDLTRFQAVRSIDPAQARHQVGLRNIGPIIGIVGRLQAWKGMHVLINAMPEVLRHYPMAQCVIVGGPFPAEPDYPRRLSQQVIKMGLQSHVQFAGMQRNVPLWMQAMDIIVHASDREPFGIVVVEGLYLGRPVIAATPGGPDEIIKDGVNGFLVRFGDPSTLADRIIQILRKPLLFDSEATHFSSLKYTDEAFAERTVVAIEAILRK
jgi:glycosyltransferase involved in cell wall biosynthesis